MNRINKLFQEKQKNILSVYFTAGYPYLDTVQEIIAELQNAGVSLVEIGIPFSDPMADGATIQHSSAVALQNGMTMKKLFIELENVRKKVHIPLIMMGYLNSFIQFGFENFCKECSRISIDGMIIPDLPFSDYLVDYKPIADKYNLKIIMLITPETSEERIKLIDEMTDGFIYMVSSAATTGAQSNFDEAKQAYFRRINAMNLRNPRLVGFGISNKKTLDAAFENASGAIVGSKFIHTLGENNDISSAVKALLISLAD